MFTLQITYPASIKVRTHTTVQAAGGKGRIIETDIHYKAFVQDSFCCLGSCDHLSGDHFVPCGHDIHPPVLSSPKLYLASSITTVSAVGKTPILCPSLRKTFKTCLHLLDPCPELLCTFTTLYCTVASPRGTNATGGDVTHEPGQPGAFTSLVFHPGLVLPPVDTAFCTVRL